MTTTYFNPKKSNIERLTKKSKKNKDVHKDIDKDTASDIMITSRQRVLPSEWRMTDKVHFYQRSTSEDFLV